MPLSTKKVAAGFGWVMFSNTLNRVLGFGTTLLLAKLLTPEHFGLVAAAETMIAILKIFRDLGIGQALIYTPRNDAVTHDTAYVMTLVLSVVLFVVAGISAPFMAAFLETPSLTPVLIVMSSSIIALTVRSVPDALIRKDIAFQKMVAPDLLAVLIASVVGIVLALNDFGVWSLVIRTLVFYWLGTFFLWRVCDYRPKLRFDRAIALELFHYSKFIVGSAILFMALYNVDRLFISKLEGMVALGIYTLAMGLANMPVSEFGHLVCRVIFPVFSKVKDDAAELRKYLIRAMTVESLVTVPMAAGLIVYGPLLTTHIFEDKWQGLGPALQVLTLAALFRALSVILHEFLRAIGDPKTVQTMVAFRLVMLCAGGWHSIHYGGLLGFCWLMAGSNLLALIVEMLIVRRRVGVSAIHLVSVSILPTLLSLLAIGGSYWLMLRMDTAPSLLLTLVFAALSAAAYFGLFALIDRKRLRGLIAELRGK